MFRFLNQIWKKISSRDINSEAKFWNWFVQNKLALEEFIDSDKSDYSIHNQLSRKIRIYNSNIFPELTTNDDGYLLVITADGNEKGFKPVIELYNSFPEIKNWSVQKFRDFEGDLLINFEGVEFPWEKISLLFEYTQSDEKIDLHLYIPGYSKNEKGYESLAYLYLDHILGEFNVITKVRYVYFFNLDDGQIIKGGLNLRAFRKIIEK